MTPKLVTFRVPLTSHVVACLGGARGAQWLDRVNFFVVPHYSSYIIKYGWRKRESSCSSAQALKLPRSLSAADGLSSVQVGLHQGAKSQQARERNAAKAGKGPQSQLKSNAAAMTIQCNICKQSFQGTSKKPL